MSWIAEILKFMLFIFEFTYSRNVTWHLEIYFHHFVFFEMYLLLSSRVSALTLQVLVMDLWEEQ